MDDDLHQILVCFRVALAEPNLEGKYMAPMVCMIRCIRRVVGGLRGPPPLIWLAIVVLKMGFGAGLICESH